MDEDRDLIERLPGEYYALTRPSPQGFTQAPEIASILNQYEEPPTRGGTIRFWRLPAADAARLLTLLPGWQGDDRQNLSPTLRQFVEAGHRCPQMSFTGYRVVPERSDERVTIDGFVVPALVLPHESVRDLWTIASPSQAAINDDQPPYTQVSEGETMTSVDIVNYADIDAYLRFASDDVKRRQALSAYWD